MRGTPPRCPAALLARPSPRILTDSDVATKNHDGDDEIGTAPMCLRCGVIDRPYRSWPTVPAGLGDYGLPPDLSPPEYGPAPTGGFFGVGASGRDYRMTTGRWDRGRAVGGNILTRLRVIR
jgi:hypothetical protein